ncbi:MAG TPA: nuclear transport factor 2 family protein [Candidatus Sulfotelmatobacter sp.]|nr:nuclear transport factor 2 family protein [Candidatus Sulfotelmatobacter sp.]
MRADDDVEAAVIGVLDELSKQVSNKDVDGVCRLFTEDEDVIWMGGEAEELAQGPEALKELLTKTFQQPPTYVIRWRTRLVSAKGDVAWVVANPTVHIRVGDEEVRAPFRVSAVLVYRSGEWKLIVFHSSEPSPAEQAPAEPDPQ